ncbi:probable serine/threonine-protein kinase nek3 [Clytia hemisphaerica]
MWSLGILIYEMATLTHPFVASDFQSLIVKIVSGKYPPVPGCFGPLIEDLVLILLQVNPNDRPNASQLLKVPTLQPHIRSYLLHAKNNGRSKSQERLNVTSNDSQTMRRKSPVEFRKNNNLDNFQCLNPTNIDLRKASLDRLDIQPTDSAYGSENEYTEALSTGKSQRRNAPTTEIYTNVQNKSSFGLDASESQPSAIYANVVPELKANIRARSKSEAPDQSMFCMREDIGQKRSSYIEAIATTDQSSNDLNITFIASTGMNEVSRSTRRRSIETSSTKKCKDTKSRRRSCEVETTGSKSKLKLPRRLSVDSIGDKKELQARNEEKDKPKIKGSLSTLKKLIRRNSKSSYETIEDSLKMTNQKVAKTTSANQNDGLKAHDEKQANKKTKPATNFIERNKKLAETPKGKAAKKPSEKKEPKATGKASKISNLSVVSEASPIVSKQRKIPSTQKSAEKKKKAAITSPSGKTPITFSWKQSSGKTPDNKDTTITEADLFLPLLRKRSLTFDSRETFMKFGASAVDSNMTKNLDVTELDCIDVFNKNSQEKSEAVDVIMPLKSDTKSKRGQKKKVRHQSSNVFPDGFRVKETVKRKIMGRLRAASYTCDNTTSCNGQKQENSGGKGAAGSFTLKANSTIDDSNNRKMQHSTTYTVLNSNATTNNPLTNIFPERNIDPHVVDEAIRLIKNVSLSPHSVEQLCQAAAMIDGDNNRNDTLVTLLRLSLTK